MPNKIDENTKQSASFSHAVSLSCNNREAARFNKCFADDNDFSATPEAVKSVLVAISREPSIDTSQYKVYKEKGGQMKLSRSKLVMEYAKHNRMYANIVKLRQVNKSLCDNILSSVSVDEMNASGNPRAFVLDVLSQRVNP